jgi:hypothetical protein
VTAAGNAVASDLEVIRQHVSGGKGVRAKGSQIVRPEPKWYQGPIAKAALADNVGERTALAADNPSS